MITEIKSELEQQIAYLRISYVESLKKEFQSEEIVKRYLVPEIMKKVCSRPVAEFLAKKIFEKISPSVFESATCELEYLKIAKSIIEEYFSKPTLEEIKKEEKYEKIKGRLEKLEGIYGIFR